MCELFGEEGSIYVCGVERSMGDNWVEIVEWLVDNGWCVEVQKWDDKIELSIETLEMDSESLRVIQRQLKKYGFVLDLIRAMLMCNMVRFTFVKVIQWRG